MHNSNIWITETFLFFFFVVVGINRCLIYSNTVYAGQIISFTVMQ